VRLRYFVCLLSILIGSAAYAQNVDVGMGFLPYESYQSADFDSVNLSDGNVVLQIPLISFPQKGTLPTLSLSVNYNSYGWYDEEFCDEDFDCSDEWMPLGGTPWVTWVSDSVVTLNVGYYDPCFPPMTVMDGSGAAHAMGYVGTSSTTPSTLRSIDGSGYQIQAPQMSTSGCPTSTKPTGGSDTVIISKEGILNSGGTYATPMMTNVSDPHGNSVGFYYNTSTSSFGYTDSLSRNIPLPNNVYWTSPHCTTLNYPGPPGSESGTVPIEYCAGSITVTSPDGFWSYPMVMLESVTLPNGTSWNFTYNSLGDLTEVTTPTGGTVSYTWTWGTTRNDGYGTDDPRWLEYRDVNDGAGSKRWTYNLSQNIYAGTASNIVTDPAGNDTVHSFVGGIFNPYYETETQYYTGSHSSGTLLKTDTISFSPVTSTSEVDGSFFHVPATVTTMWGASGPVSEKCMYYDRQDHTGSGLCPSATFDSSALTFHLRASTYATYQGIIGNEVERDEYDNGSSSAGSLLRKTVTDYVSSSPYLTANLLQLPDSVNVYDSASNQCNGASNPCAETTYAYDESGASSCSSSAPCGDLTTVNRYVSASTYLTTHYHYNSNGMLTIMCDPIDTSCANPTQYSYDSTGLFLNEIQYPTTNGGSTTHVEHPAYDSNTGLLTSNQDQNEQTTTYTYDSMRRLTSVSHPDGGSDAFSYNDTVSYPSSPNFTYTKAITSGSSFVETGVVDGLGRKIETNTTVPTSTCSSGHVYVNTSYGFDSTDHVSTQTVSNPDCSTTHSYSTLTWSDPLNRVTKVTEQDGSTVTTDYSSFPYTTVTDEAGNKRKSLVDGADRLKGVWEDPSGSDYETDYTYDTNDNLTSVSQSSSRTRTFTYDFLSRLLTSLNPEMGTASHPEYGTITYTYDNDGNLITKVAPQANQSSSSTTTTTYCYDELNRLLKKAYVSTSCSAMTPAASYAYDGNSPSGCSVGSFSYGNPKPHRTAMCDAAGTEAWSYDPMGRPTNDQRTTDSITKTTTPVYNYDGSIYTLTYPTARTITYEPNYGMPPLYAKDLTNSINYATSAVYTPSGALASLNNGSSLVSTLYYNSRLQPCRISVESGLTPATSCTDSTNTGNELDLKYSFNLGSSDNGNVTTITNDRDTTRSQAFTYDALNRLATGVASTYATSPTNCWGESYVYDNVTGSHAWGNLIQINSPGSSYTGCTHGENLNVSASALNQIHAVTGPDFTYDVAGNMTNDLVHNYTFDAENHIIQVDGTPGTCSTAVDCYVYDGDGKRVEKATSSVSEIYWYDTSGNVLDETDGSGSLQYEYVFFNGSRIARRDPSSNVDYYFADHLGSARVLTDAGGTILDDCDYYPFGGLVYPSCSTSSGNHYKFTGKERDSESGLDDFDARHYGSSLGRFMSPDPAGLLAQKPTYPQSWNLYAYAMNNPLIFIDPTGLDCVYANNAGNGVESIDHDSNSGECGSNGGTWAPGYVDENWATFNQKTQMFQVGSVDGAGSNATVDYTNFAAGAQTDANGNCTSGCGGYGFASANANWLQSQLVGNSMLGGLDGYIQFLTGRQTPLQGGLLMQLAAGPLDPSTDHWAGPGGMGPPGGRGDWAASVHDYNFSTNDIKVGSYFNPTLSLSTSRALIKSNNTLMRNAGGIQSLKMGLFFGPANALQWYANSWK